MKKSAASYSFGMKTEAGGTRGEGPAPNAYKVEPIKEAPAYSLASKARSAKLHLTPAPGNYEVGHLSGPSLGLTA